MSASTAHRKKFTGCKTVTVPQGYVGDIKENLREGYGVYTYPNSFFRYEGEWQKGTKQGCGKFKMRDGSYYEGQFVDGEITGTGIRFWADNGQSYEGQFQDGEMNGFGVMKYADGSIYEGPWVNNKREGEGTLYPSEDNVYTGSFHLNKRHGEGKQVYKLNEEYEGGWVNGMRHGHGVMKFQDGSLYVGQWRCDLMNGEGYLQHSSQLTYNGLWLNGRPLSEAIKLCIGGKEVITVEQNDPTFSLEIQCQTADNELVTGETGRQLKVIAGIRIPDRLNASSKTSYLSMESSTHIATGDERKATPFGFDVEAYPISFKPASVKVKGGSKISEEDNEDVSKDLSSRTSLERCSKDEKISPVVDKINTATKLQNDAIEKKPVGNSPLLYEAIIDFPSVPPQRTSNGQAEFINLILPALAPPGTQSSMCLSPESVDSRGGVRTRLPSFANPKKLEDMTKGELRDNSGVKKKKNKQSKHDEKVEEVLNENLCKPGDYVIIVEDITEPTFLNNVLEACYLHVKVLAPVKKTKSRGNERNVKI